MSRQFGVSQSTRAGMAARNAVVGVFAALATGVLVPAAQAAPVNGNGTTPINAVACPTTPQCTGVDRQGYQVTFNPQRTQQREPDPGSRRRQLDPSRGG